MVNGLEQPKLLRNRIGHRTSPPVGEQATPTNQRLLALQWSLPKQATLQPATQFGRQAGMVRLLRFKDFGELLFIIRPCEVVVSDPILVWVLRCKKLSESSFALVAADLVDPVVDLSGVFTLAIRSAI
jgi:hypothetical protein